MKDYNDGGFDFYGESYGRNDGFEGKNYLQQLVRPNEYSVFYENQFHHGILFECKYNMHLRNMKCFRSIGSSIDLEVLVALAKYAGSDVLYQL